MKNEETDSIVFLVIIAGRKQKDALLSILPESGAHLVHTMYGKGTINASYLKRVFGLIPEENKVVITCVLTNDHAAALMTRLTEQFNFNKPNTGIAFTVTIDRLSF
jgi:hypothetical protein